MYGELTGTISDEISELVERMLGDVAVAILDEYPTVDWEDLHQYLFDVHVDLDEGGLDKDIMRSVGEYLKARGQTPSRESELMPEEFEAEDLLGEWEL